MNRKRKAAAVSGQSKKPKKNGNNAKKNIDEEDDNTNKLDASGEVIQTTVYIMIPKNQAPATSKGRAKSQTVDPLQKGPFTLLSTDSYDIFLDKVSDTLPCRRQNIHENKLQWKPKTPKNADLLLVGGEKGYPVMVEEISGRRTGRIILLFMPAPAEPMEEETVSHNYGLFKG